MRKYNYTANINGNQIETNSIEALTNAINETIGFPIVSKDMLYNYFIRPNVVKHKKLQSLNLRRELISVSGSG